MVNEKYYGYGTAPSIIRELFAYGLEQAKKPAQRLASSANSSPTDWSRQRNSEETRSTTIRWAIRAYLLLKK